jgi:hypothetical protein
MVRNLRFNIASLLFVVLVLGVGFAALRESNDLWESGLFTLTIGVLLIAILLAVHRREAKRAFWFGFALFGWGYLALSLVPSIESRLMTTKALAYLDSKVPRRLLRIAKIRHIGSWQIASGSQSNPAENAPFGVRLAASDRRQVRLWDATTGKMLAGWTGTTENFVRIGHSFLTLLAAWLGGLVSRRLWRASRAPQEPREVIDNGTNQ